MNYYALKLVNEAQHRDYQTQAENHRLQIVGRADARSTRKVVMSTVGRRLVQFGTFLQDQTEA